MTWALSHSHVVLTHDLDMGAILAVTQASGPSVIQVRRQDVMPSSMAELLTGTLREYEAELMAGALIVVHEGKSRVRILPLRR